MGSQKQKKNLSGEKFRLVLTGDFLTQENTTKPNVQVEVFHPMLMYGVTPKAILIL